MFTWHLPIAKAYADSLARPVRIGGPAIELAKKTLPGFFLGSKAIIGGNYPGVLQRWNPHATRTSIGCPRLCKFCSVPLVEGAAALEEFGERIVPLPEWPDLPVIADNNLLGTPLDHLDRVYDRLEKHEWCDFNQGTDARFLTEHHAERIARLKQVVVRLALDSLSYKDSWERALELLLKAGVKKRQIRTYCVMGFGTPPEGAGDGPARRETHRHLQGAAHLRGHYHQHPQGNGSDGVWEASEVGVNDPLKPSLALLSKLGSIIVHADELMSPKGHHFDKTVLDGLLQDTEVREWMKAMGPLLPLKR